MILDTNLLIQFERETRQNLKGIATTFFDKLPSTRMCITPTIAGEFCSGASLSKRHVWDGFCAAYEMLAITNETAWIYGELYRFLSAKGNLIGTNDLWIAATALTHDMPVATGNVREFSRVPDLIVRSIS